MGRRLFLDFAFMLAVLIAFCALKVESNRRSRLWSEFRNQTDKAGRTGKFFSLFNVVKFNNEPCTSMATTSGGGNRGGTCFTSTECADKSGMASGNCAAGFGVCCVFIRDGTGVTTISENCTYVQNEGYPTAITAASTQSFTVNKCSNDICFLRLDFERFTLVGTSGSGNANEGVCVDTFNVMTPTATVIPTICGENTGEHIYVDIGTMDGDSATLMFTTTDDAGSRTWDIKISQIECDNKNRPRDAGCLQWHTGCTGRLTSFNYANENDNHLNNQQYSICIRQECGFCCVQYQVCPDQLNMLSALVAPGSPAGFSFDTTRTNAKGDTQCQVDSNTVDYIGIQGSSAVCSPAGGDCARAINNRYCGQFLNIVKDAAANIPICDCTPPFSVDVFFNNVIDDKTGAAAANTKHSRGFCLEYMQIAC